MCNQYRPPKPEVLRIEFGVAPPEDLSPRVVGPKFQGYYIRRKPRDSFFNRELDHGRWGLIPNFATTPDIPYSTNNARWEEIETKPAFRQPWAQGHRCIIPVSAFWEPCWESGKNVWWGFQRADGRAFGLAGLWNDWVHKETGEVFPSFTMLTINADLNPLMNRMHKPNPNLPPNAQDKRMVVVIEPEHWDAWLYGKKEVAKKLPHAAPAEIFLGSPDNQRHAGTLPPPDLLTF